MYQEYVKDFSGRILGIVQSLDNGDQIIKDFNTRQILGYYRARLNHTTDFRGVVIAKGNAAASLIYNANKK